MRTLWCARVCSRDRCVLMHRVYFRSERNGYTVCSSSSSARSGTVPPPHHNHRSENTEYAQAHANRTSEQERIHKHKRRKHNVICAVPICVVLSKKGPKSIGSGQMHTHTQTQTFGTGCKSRIIYAAAGCFSCERIGEHMDKWKCTTNTFTKSVFLGCSSAVVERVPLLWMICQCSMMN